VNSSLLILVLIAFVFFAIVSAYFSYQKTLQRVSELVTLAQELDWKFSSDEDYYFGDRYSQFSVFSQGNDHWAENTLEGRIRTDDDAWPARMGDYHYTTTSSDGKTTTTHHHHFSYLLVQLPYPSLPDLRIRREGLFDHVASAFGFSDINFESSAFSKRFHVKSTDKKFAYDVVHPAMMEFLLAVEPPTIEIDRACCCLTTGRSTWSAAEFREQLNWATKFFQLWPKHLVADLKSR
jgi:hypothetical protein